MEILPATKGKEYISNLRKLGAKLVLSYHTYKKFVEP
jgi:hypothetical protein